MAIIKDKTSKGELRFKVRVRRANGKWYPQVTCYSKAEALQIETDLLEQAERDLTSMALNIVPSPKLGALVLGSMNLDAYFIVWARERRSKSSDGWKLTQNQMYRKYIQPLLGAKKLLEITRQDIGIVMIEADVTHKKSEQTRLHVYQLMHRMFGDAVDYYEVLGKNPVTKDFRVAVIQEERNFLAPAQSYHLLKVSQFHWAGPAIWLALLAGMRIGEIQALKVNALFFEQGYISIRANYCRRTWKLQDYPKGKKWGRTPMSPLLVDYLKQVVANKGPDDFVCNGPESVVLHYTVFLINLKKLCEDNGLPIVTPHELRHSASELFIEQGASVEDVRRLLQHKSGATTMRYIHRTEERLSNLAEKVGSKIGGELNSFREEKKSVQTESVNS